MIRRTTNQLFGLKEIDLHLQVYKVQTTYKTTLFSFWCHHLHHKNIYQWLSSINHWNLEILPFNNFYLKVHNIGMSMYYTEFWWKYLIICSSSILILEECFYFFFVLAWFDNCYWLSDKFRKTRINSQFTYLATQHTTNIKNRCQLFVPKKKIIFTF